ncbi:hypothetical protein NDU88_004983 [Pleurodeles waltl]|uniref:Uncharacterized protein n=1 Tax=Pleurodeles waltl TaxID=8319 RepID=A0AAV7NQ53_PLEWA|nr:hypothetical protein NDU88_004983 [Pleurodeles waltl]
MEGFLESLPELRNLGPDARRPDVLLTQGTGRVALFGESLLANSGPFAPERTAASGQARPERDGSEPLADGGLGSQQLL